MTRRKIIFVVILLGIQLGLIWPVYPFFSGIRPFVLGLPLSFFWVLVMLISAFGLMVWYYLTDPKVPAAAAEGPPGGPVPMEAGRGGGPQGPSTVTNEAEAEAG